MRRLRVTNLLGGLDGAAASVEITKRAGLCTCCETPAPVLIWFNCPHWGSRAGCTGGDLPRCPATCKRRPALARISRVRKLSVVSWHIQSANTHCHRSVTLRTLLVIIIDQLECDEAGRPGGGLRGRRGMLIKVIDQITDEDMHETVWTLYQDAFEDLNTMA